MAGARRRPVSAALGTLAALGGLAGRADAQAEECLDHYDDGTNDCTSMVAQGYTCSDFFCASCAYAGYCDLTCGVCDVADTAKAAAAPPAPPAGTAACFDSYDSTNGAGSCDRFIAGGYDCASYFCGEDSCPYSGYCDLACELCVPDAGGPPAPAPTEAAPEEEEAAIDISTINPEGVHDCPDLYGTAECEDIIVSGLYGCDADFCLECDLAGYCDGMCGYCPLPEPEPEPEPEPIPEPEPAPEPGESWGCEADQIRDCRGECVASHWLGDDFCDDNARYSLYCEELAWDAGDCLVPEDAIVLDCLGQEAPSNWIGDGNCDNGVSPHDNKWIDFNCVERNFDGGDCAGERLTQMQCLELLRGLDACDSTDGRVDGCRSAGCSEAIVSMRAGWEDCNGQLGEAQSTEDLIHQYELICGECSPLPVLDVCGIFRTFPTTETCSSLCAPALILWFEEQYDQCQAHMIEEMEASMQDLLNLQAFYARCKETPVEAASRPQDECAATDLGAVGSARVSIPDDSGQCSLSMSLFEEACGTQLSSCIDALQLQAELSHPAPTGELECTNDPSWTDANGNGCEHWSGQGEAGVTLSCSMTVLVAALGTDLSGVAVTSACCDSCPDQCVRSEEDNPNCHRGWDGCAPVFLGPDIGWSSSVFDPHRECRENITRVEETCGQHWHQCIVFLDVLHEHPIQTGRDQLRWSADGTLVLSSRPEVGLLGSEEQAIFVQMLRRDISYALDISEDYVSVVNIELPDPYPREEPPGGNQWWFVTYELTNFVSEVGVLRQIKNIESQAINPDSRLLQGDATSNVIAAGEVALEVELHPCSAVFLGPDVGYVEIFKPRPTGRPGDCALDMDELLRVCADFYTECLQYLYPESDCVEGLIIANSNRNASDPCLGRVGELCGYRCDDGFTAAGEHQCRPTGAFAGGACEITDCRNSVVPNSASDCGSVPVGGACLVHCNPGFTLVGTDPVCGADGQFSGGVCEPNKCPESSINNSPSVCSDLGTGQVCDVSCDAGYMLQGTVVCGPDGRLSGGICVPAPCTAGLMVSHSDTVCEGVLNSRCNIECSEGYESRGRHRCGADGAFSGGWCEPTACETLAVEDSATSCTGATGDSCVPECFGSFVFDGSLTCGPDGWDGGGFCRHINACDEAEAAECGPLAVCERTGSCLHGSCTFVCNCNAGYFQTGQGCAPWTDCLASVQFEETPPTSQADRVCSSVSGCKPGERVVRSPSASEDTVCGA